MHGKSFNWHTVQEFLIWVTFFAIILPGIIQNPANESLLFIADLHFNNYKRCRAIEAQHLCYGS